MPFEIAETLLEVIEQARVEQLFEVSRAVPEGNLPRRLQPQELIKDMRSHGRHPGATSDEHHLVVGSAGQELAVRPRQAE